MVLLSGFQSEEVKSEAPTADVFRDSKQELQLLRTAENQTELKTVIKIQVEGTI